MSEWFRELVCPAGVPIQSSRVQGLHPATSGICFSISPELKSSVSLCKKPTDLPPATWDIYAYLKYVSFVSVACL